MDNNIIRSLKETEEFNQLVNKLNIYNDILQDNDLKAIMNFTGVNNSYGKMVKTIDELIISFIKILLKDYIKKISITSKNGKVVIKYSKMINSCYVEEEDVHYYPSETLFIIDFTTETVIERKLKNEYLYCYNEQSNNISRLSYCIENLKRQIDSLKSKKKTNLNMAIEIYTDNKYFIRKSCYFFNIIKTYFFKNYKKNLINTFENLIKSKEDKLKNMEDTLSKTKRYSYIEIYRKIDSLQQSIISTLKELNFTIITEDISSRGNSYHG